jgi:hypothetical protein
MVAKPEMGDALAEILLRPAEALQDDPWLRALWGPPLSR